MNQKKVRNGFLTFAAALGIALSIPIWRELGHQRDKAQLARNDMRQEQKILRGLKAEKTRYKDPAAVEELLRERGYWEKDAKAWQPTMPKPTDDFGAASDKDEHVL